MILGKTGVILRVFSEKIRRDFEENGRDFEGSGRDSKRDSLEFLWYSCDFSK